MTREDRWGEFSVRLARPLSGDWRLVGEYRYTDSNSNFSEFDYARHVVTFGVARRF